MTASAGIKKLLGISTAGATKILPTDTIANVNTVTNVKFFTFLFIFFLFSSYSATSAPPTASSSTVSPSSPSSALVRVPFVASLNIGPNVSPPSVLILATGVSLVWFAAVVAVSHQLTTTASPSPAISTLQESASVVLLRFILSPKVAPPSVEALNITSSLPFSVLFVHQAMYILSPDTTAG